MLAPKVVPGCGLAHNEYKLILQHVLLGLEVSWFGQVHLLWWIWIGNLLLLACLVPVWLCFLPKAPLYRRLLLFTPAVWICLNLDYAETLDWALSGMQEVAVLFLGILCIFLSLRRERSANLVSCAVALVACCTYANAFMLAPLGVVLFGRGKRRVLAVWVGCFGLALLLYLYHYTFLAHPHAPAWTYGLYWCALIGSAVTVHLSTVLPTLLGMAALMVVAFWWREWRATNALYLWVAVWLMLTLALTAYGRSWVGLASALSSRYRIYSVFVLGMVYLLGVSRMHDTRVSVPKRTFACVCVAAVMFGLLSDVYGYKLLSNRRQWLRYGMQHYQASNGQASPMVYSAHPAAVLVRPETEQRVRDILNEARTRNLYHVPATY